MEETLREFLSTYIGQGTEKKDIVTSDAVEMLIFEAITDGIGQDIIDYGTEHPDAPFWDFLAFIKPGLVGVTDEELMEDGE
ncbi:MAG: hypothetical protein LUJ09_07235 [Firmicutes bacterium]|nr:hypothetical protein [Bacillota bacterium]